MKKVGFIIIALIIIFIIAFIFFSSRPRITAYTVRERSITGLAVLDDFIKEIARFFGLSKPEIGVKAEALIIDHNAVQDFMNLEIPEYWIQKAKDDLHIAYGHTSHGQQIVEGMEALVEFMNNGGLGNAYSQDLFTFNYGGSDGALDFWDLRGEWRDHAGRYPGFYDKTRAILDNPENSHINVFIWTFDHELEWVGPNLQSRYFTPMETLEADYPDVTFIYATSRAPSPEDIGTEYSNTGEEWHTRLERFNDVIRDYAIANNKVLFDTWDLEHHDPDREYAITSDYCDYYDSDYVRQGNWCSEWQDSHTEVDWFMSESSHSLPLNANQKAYAFWYMLARLAGWDGVEGTPPPAPYCGDGSCNGDESCSTCPQDCGSCPPDDTTPPVRSNGLPTGTLSAGTTQTILSLTTNENANCRYSTTSGISFTSMTNTFTTTGRTSHSTTISGLSAGVTYNYYIRCQDNAGNANPNDYLISFSIAQPSPGGPKTCQDISARPCVEISSCQDLNQANTYYLLTNDITSEMSCMFIGRDNITFDLNGYTLTYGATPTNGIPNYDFELGQGQIPDNWDLSGAPSAKRVSTSEMPFYGQWLLKFENTADEEEVVSDWITLPANRTYTATVGLVSNDARGSWEAELWHRIWVEREGSSEPVCSSRDNSAEGGMIYCNFKPASQGNYRLHVVKEADSRRHTSFIDLADIRPSYDTGIFMGYTRRAGTVPVGTPDYTGKAVGCPTNTVIKNGKIKQAGLTTFAKAIYANDCRRAIELYDLEIEVGGVDSVALQNLGNANIHNNTFISQATWVVNRHQLTGNVISGLGSNSQFYDNEIDGGTGGIQTATGITDAEIYNNLIRINGTITNHYSINVGCSAKNVRIYNNTIEPYKGAGILLTNCAKGDSTNPDPVGVEDNLIYNNTIRLTNHPPTPDYPTVYNINDGIRVTDYNANDGGTYSRGYPLLTRRNKFYNNTIYGEIHYYPEYPQGLANVRGISINTGGGDNEYYDNTIIVRAEDERSVAEAIYIGRASNGGKIYNNYLESNNIHLAFTTTYGQIASNTIFTNNTLKVGENPVNYNTHKVGGWHARAIDNEFISNVYLNGASLDDWVFSDSEPDSSYSFYAKWFLNLNVIDDSQNPVSGADVRVYSAREDVNAVTNSQGLAQLTLTQYYRSGVPSRRSPTSNYLYYTPHTITVRAAGYPTFTGQLTMDSTKSLILNIEKGTITEGPISPPPPPPPATLDVTLSAAPASGRAPLQGVVLTADVSGTAQGTINYTFYCNRSDTGTNITSDFDYKQDGTSADPYSAPADTCNSIYSNPGTYTAKVIAERGGLQAEARATIIITVPPDTTPLVISDVTINPSYNSAIISWTTNKPADSQIDYGLTSDYNLSSTLDSDLVTTHRVTLGSLRSETTYHFQIRTSDEAANQATSADFSFTTLTPPDITAPIITNVSFSTTESSATINWTTNEPATSQVGYGFTASYGQLSDLVTVLSTNHTITLTGLSARTTYHFYTRSEDTSGNLGMSLDRTFTTKSAPADVTPPAAITDLATLSVDSDSAILTWTTPGDDENSGTVFRYELRYSQTPITEENWPIASLVAIAPEPQVAGSKEVYTLTGLVSDATYYVILKAVDEADNSSELSNLVSFTTLSPEPEPEPEPEPTPVPAPHPGGGGGRAARVPVIAPPANFVATAADSQIFLSWQNPQDNSFARSVVVRKTSGYPLNQTDGDVVYEGTRDSFVDTNLANNTTYYYSIFAYTRNLNYSTAAHTYGIPQAHLSSFQPADQKPQGILIKAKTSPQVYLITQSNHKRYIPNEVVFLSYGFRWSEIQEVKAETLSNYPDSTPLTYANGVLLKAPESPAVYLVKDGGRQVFFNHKYFLANGYQWPDIFTVPLAELNSLRLTANVKYPDGTLIKGDTAAVYLLQNQKLRKIATEEVFNQLGLHWHNIIVISGFEMTMYQLGEPINSGADLDSDFIKALDSDNDTLYDYNELIFGTDLNNADTDGDGYSDGEEVKTHNDPLK